MSFITTSRLQNPRLKAEAVVASATVGDASSDRDRAIRRLLAVADVAGVLLGLLALGLASQRPTLPLAILLSLPTVPLWLLIFGAHGLYRRDQILMGHLTVDDVPWMFQAMLMGCPLLWVYLRWFPGDDHFGKIVAFGLTCGVSMIVLRSLARSVGSRLIAPERLLLLGQRDEMAILAAKLQSHPGYGVEMVAWVTAPAFNHSQVDNVDILDVANGGESHGMSGRDVDFHSFAAENRIDRVVLAQGDVDQQALLELMRECKKLSIKVSILPQLSDAMGRSVEVDEVSGITLLAISPPRLSRGSRVAKRTLDVVGAAALLLASLPLMAMCAIAIKLNSEGPVLFRQQRVGRRGTRFSVLKFRTMGKDAEQLRDSLLAASHDSSWLHLEHDPRITRVGELLRHTSIDELPQLWNVLKGEMSLVGPRPLIPSEDENLVGWTRTRLDLTPGLSGLWQVLGRTNIPFDEMIKLDYLYVTNWSLWGDIRLIVRTVPAVLSRRGVN